MAYIRLIKSKDSIPNVDPKKHIGKKVRVSYGTAQKEDFGKITNYEWTPVFGGEYTITLNSGRKLVIPATKLYPHSDKTSKGVYLEDKRIK